MDLLAIRIVAAGDSNAAAEPALLPRRCSPGAAGIDLCAAEPATLPPGGRGALVRTGFACALPPGTVGIIKSRSSLAAKHDVEVGAGVIDEDYRGEVRVLLRNFGAEPFEVRRGDRVAQMVVLKLHAGPVQLCESLDDTARGQGGFGSTGR